MASYKDVMEGSIEKETEILGDKAIEVAEEKGISVDEEGNVTDYEGDGKHTLQELIQAYMNLGGTVTATLIAKALEDMDLQGLDLPPELDERL